MIKNEAQYWERHKIYKRRLNKLMVNAKLFVTAPDLYLEKFYLILDEAEAEGVFSKEYVIELKNRIQTELNKPGEFKYWITNKAVQLKARILGK